MTQVACVRALACKNFRSHASTYFINRRCECQWSARWECFSCIVWQHLYTVNYINLFVVDFAAFRLIEPLCLGGFVGYFSSANGFNTTLNDAYWYATGIVLCNALKIIMIYPFTYYMMKISIKIRIACSGLVYQKVLRLTNSSNGKSQTGKIINLMSNDLDEFGKCVEILHDIWCGPLQSITFFFIIYVEIGFAAVIGMVFLLSFIPIQCKDE